MTPETRRIIVELLFLAVWESSLQAVLTSYSKSCDIIRNEQAGFRQGFSTADHIFAFKSLIDLYLFKKKRLYCCFVDYSKVVNLAPLLFCFFLSDFRDYLSSKYNGLSFINNNISDLLNDINLDKYLKLYVLLYAGDTVILAESPKELQLALDAMDQYCTLWKRKINVSKTKVLIFSRGYVRNRPEFTLGNVKLEIVRDYQYIGLISNYNGKFNKANQKLFEKGRRAMFSLLRKARCLFLPPDVLFKLFNHILVPIITYGCELWGSENIDIIEKLQLKF